MPKHKQLSKYKPQEIEHKWQRIWREQELHTFKPDSKKQKYYNLVELPYPSGDLHLGHWFSFVTADTHARYKKMKGFNVFFPNGFDAFGLPAENAAIKRGLDPKEWTLSNIAAMHKQFDTMGTMIDWTHEAITCLPEYYRWNQWIFLQMLEKRLAYRGKALANWCPNCQTVLANENVEAGKCWRCGTEVIQKEVEQWFLKITEYADDLLWKENKNKKSSEEDLSGLTRFGEKPDLRTKTNITEKNEFVKNSDNLSMDLKGIEPSRPEFVSPAPKPGRPMQSSAYNNNNNSVNSSNIDWPKSVREGQNNWIGKREGIEITYEIEDSSEKITVFTTRPDTNFGATFIALAPEHPLVTKISNELIKSITNYVNNAKKKTELERQAEGREKTGVFTGLYAINQLTGYKMPIYISDFVLGGYGTGALVGVPAHDLRDFEFATKFGIKIIRVVVGKDKDTSPITRIDQVQEDQGTMINSDFLNGMDIHEATKKIMDYMEEKGYGKKVTTYHIHDWSISRQRYWGTPIPVIYCVNCWNFKFQISNVKYKEGVDYTIIDGKEHAIVPVPLDQLPVELPEGVDFTPKGEPPLATAKDWINVRCPKCGGKAKRDAETMDTFFDSSWYYYRYVTPHYTQGPFDKLRVKQVLPVDIYYGGAEHTLGHTLYARFFTKFFKDLGLVSFDEFAKRRVQHGVILGTDGNRMSKSKGNVVNPDELVKEFGTDTVRTYLCFMMPYEATSPWSPEGIWGSYRFLKRVWELQNEFQISNFKFPISNQDLVWMHRTIKKVGEDIEGMKFNTAVATLMTWMNYLEEKQSVSEDEYKNLLLVVAPFAPHMTEELWEISNFHPPVGGPNSQSIHLQPWPEYDEKYLVQDEVAIVVQINGKMRDSMRIKNQESRIKEAVEEKARESEKIRKHLEGKTIKKTIYVPGKIINFVI